MGIFNELSTNAKARLRTFFRAHNIALETQKVNIFLSFLSIFSLFKGNSFVPIS